MAVTAWGQVYIQATAPAEEPVQIGSIWVDTNGTAAVKVCTSISPHTFAITSGGVPAAHATSHQNGGSDEISVVGLSGLLADGQTPLAHKTSHENGGSDEISVAGLSGLLGDAQTALAGTAKPTEQTTTATGTQNNFDLSAEFTYLRVNNASAVTVTGFTVATVTPTTNCVVIIENIGSSTVKVAHQDAGSTAANRIITASTSGQIVGAGGRMIGVYDVTTDRWRVSPLNVGAPITVPYNAGDFTGDGSMTWTVDSGDVTTYAYEQYAKKINVTLALQGTSVGGTLSNKLKVALPSGFTATKFAATAGYVRDNGTFTSGALQIFNATGTIEIVRTDAANWAASTNLTNVFGFFEFEID